VAHAETSGSRYQSSSPSPISRTTVFKMGRKPVGVFFYCRFTFVKNLRNRVRIHGESTGVPAYGRRRKFVIRPPAHVMMLHCWGVLAIRSLPGAWARIWS
jgi:hypothetical protein